MPPELIPDQAKEEIIAQVNAEFDELTAMRTVNPFDVGYLKPSPEAMYRPPRVTLSFFNADKKEWSRPGTVYIDYTSGGGRCLFPFPVKLFHHPIPAAYVGKRD